jgi:hypothetical protein
VPVAAGVVGDALELALVARLDMTAESRGAARSDSAQDAPMFAAERFFDSMAVTFDDIRQFQRGALE